jgi:phage protein D
MRPLFEITADDVRITKLIRDRFISLNITDEAGFESDTLDITLDNRDLMIEPPKTGAELKVSLGYKETGVRPMGLFMVDEYERSGLPHKITIRAKSAYGGDGRTKSVTVNGITTKLKEQRTRSWDGQTLGTIVSQIAAECGLEPRIDAALAAEVIAHVDQTDESNAHFLQRLARDRDSTFKPAGGFLLFVPRSQAKTAMGESLPLVYLTLGEPKPTADKPNWARLSGNEDSYRLTVAERQNFKSVTAYYHDVSAAERKEVTVGEGEPSRKLRGNFATPEEAAQAAAAELRRIGRGKSAPTFNCEGDPLLAAEGKLVVDDSMGSDLEGEWVITRAVHKMDGGGYVADVECEVPEAKRAAAEKSEVAE